MDINKIAEDIIAKKEDDSNLRHNCIKAGICRTCGKLLKAETLVKENVITTKTWLGLFKGYSNIITKENNKSVRVYCKDGHQECIETSANWGTYSETLNKEISEQMSKLHYYCDDEDGSY
jgi:hypothetical protein